MEKAISDCLIFRERPHLLQREMGDTVSDNWLTHMGNRTSKQAIWQLARKSSFSHDETMHHFGAHTSTAGGLYHAPINAYDLHADAFALFVKNQRQWAAPPLQEAEIIAFTNAVKEHRFDMHQILPHASYLINLGNPDPEKRQKSIDSFTLEMQRVRQLGLVKLNVHPGSHLGLISLDQELKLIADSLNQVMDRVDVVHPVLETTAGSGGSVGKRFEELRDIIAGCSHQERIGITIDTCHCFAAGYDIRSRESYERVMEAFGKTIGFAKLEGMHLNDSKAGLASHIDRHAPLGKGAIGLEAFFLIATDPRTCGIPLILETPVEEKSPAPKQWQEEIAWLRSQDR